jgi:transitional endoplasmic reticulum ATPase
LLTQLDGLEDLQDVIVIAATNRPDMVDPALLRPGRFDRIILTTVPDKESRLKILEVHTKSMPITKDVDLKKLAEQMEGYVGADIEGVCREAAIRALRQNMNAKEVTMEHFKEALKEVTPSVTKDIEKSYEEIKDHFKSARAKQMADERPEYMG